MPSLSVVIPTYNRPEFLDGAIKSAIHQTHDNLEIVVVDDGSENAYANEIVAQYPEQVRCIVHEENRGLSAARNTGIEQSDGEYIAFLDDDDRWHEGKLAKQVSALEADSGVGLATCRLASIDGDGNLLRCDGTVVDGDLSDVIYTRNVIGTPSRVVVRRDALPSERPFDETLPTKQDWDFYIRLFQEWRVVGAEEILCFRTRHGGMASDPEDAKEDNIRVIEKHREEIERRGLWSETMANYYEKVGVTYLLDGQPAPARRFLRRSISYESSVTRFAMMGLGFVPAFVFEYVLSFKRRYERTTRGCESSVEWKRVHGLEIK
ncbi:glycosyltransferase family 2 protein [Halorientalis marina]|uniref:glycosyltransferase family 2 protein n=1 Tax=Halorientalis marina TaxID=2931976 RepID=UPI001FF1FBE8|nr:glycosyltransferase family 2 protein [Halorientalis marina]